ncbi:MAG: sulfotransferase family 2 domain-containing protein [Marinilabiliaceae bacterium]|nr:sulfotransferase family 2 domain-containing protein [Marinilabiliaceae bacterium]
MPISKKYKLLFIHIPKTGGGSIEKALGVFGVDNEGCNMISRKIMYGYIPVTFENRKMFRDFLGGNLRSKIIAFFNYIIKNDKIKLIPLQHYTINEIEKKLNIKKYISFAVIRNPYDRIVSEFFWLKNNNGDFCMDLSQFILKYLPENYLNDRHLLPQYVFVTRNENICVDALIRFENLNSDCDRFFKDKGINTHLEHIHSTNKPCYNDLLNPECRSMIRNIYKKDFELLNYDV